MSNFLWAKALNEEWIFVERVLSRMPDADINTAPIEGPHIGKSILWLITYKKQWKLVSKILDQHPEANINASPQEGKEKGITVLGLVALYKQWELFEKMLAQHPEANLNAKVLNQEHSNSIFDLVYLNNPKLAYKIIAKYPEVKPGHYTLTLPVGNDQTISIKTDYLLELIHAKTAYLYDSGRKSKDTYNRCDPLAFNFFIEALSHNHVISSLHISQMKFNKELRDKLLNVIRNRPTLQKLSINYVTLVGSYGMKLLVDCLMESTNINTFTLSGAKFSQIKEEDCIRLKTLPHLTTLVLDDMVYEKNPIKLANLKRKRGDKIEVPALVDIGIFGIKKHCNFNMQEIKKLENLIPEDLYQKFIR